MVRALLRTENMIELSLQQAAKATRIYFERNIPVFWHGAPGIGKTDGAHALGASMGVPVHDWRANLRDPVDARGLPMPDLDKGCTRWLRPNDLPFEGSDFPESGILFCDEVNTASPAMQVVAMQLVHERRVGEHRLKAGWHVLAAGNRQSDRAAAQRMPTALRNRFAHITVTPDLKAWTDWANGAGIDPVVIAFLRFRPRLLHVMPGEQPEGGEAIPQDANAFPTPRAWAHVASVADIQDHDMRHALVCGLVGEGPAAEFGGFYSVWKGLPSIADIIANPDRINVPDDPATLYAVSTALARNATAKNFSPIMRFANRALGAEFSTLLVLDACKRDAGLKTTSAFIDWAATHQDVTL
jgi:hypothetical protein